MLLSLGALRLLRSSRIALTQPDAYGAGESLGGLESVGTDPACCAGNFQWLGGGFERYGYFGEEDALVGVGGC